MGDVPAIEYFYKDEYNVAIKYSKKFFRWIILNVPDFTLWIGHKKVWIVKIVLMLGTAYVFGDFLFNGGDWLTLFIRITAMSFFVGLLFSNMLAWTWYNAVLNYQRKAEQTFK